MYQDIIEQNIIALAKRSKTPVMTFIHVNREKTEENAITEKHLLQLRFLLSHQQFEKLALVIYTRGGSLHDAGMMADLLRSSAQSLRGYIPHNVYSAGSLITLACDEIVMGDNSTIGPIDPQIDMFSSKTISTSSLDIFKGLEEINKFAIDSLGQAHAKIRDITHDKLDPLDEIKLASEFATSLASKLVRDLTAKEIGNKKRVLQMTADHLRRLLKANLAYSSAEQGKIEKIIERLVYSYNDHGYPITRDEAREIGIPVVDATEQEQQMFDEIAMEIVRAESDSIFFYDPKIKQITTPDEFSL